MTIDWNSRSNAWATAILAADRLDDLLADLGCNLRQTGSSVYRGPCPVHGGDGKNLTLRTDGDAIPVNWECHSNGCHVDFKPSLLGFVRGVLSFQRARVVGLTEAEKFLKTFLGRRPPAGQRRPAPRPRPEPQLPRWTREQVRQRLQIPAPYFLQRGFSAAVLDRHDVGHSAKLKRTVVPVYDDAGEVCVAYQARSELPHCSVCDKYHRPGSACRFGQPKWLFYPTGKGQHVYNYDAALRSSSPTVLVVEGPGDVWRAEEAGHLAVALLGNGLIGTQLQKLKALRKRVLLALDRDGPGRAGMFRVESSLRQQRVPVSSILVPSPYKDLGNMSREEAARWLSTV